MFKRKKNSYFQLFTKKLYSYLHRIYISKYSTKKTRRERKKKNPFSTFNLTFSRTKFNRYPQVLLELEYQTNKFNEFLIFLQILILNIFQIFERNGDNNIGRVFEQRISINVIVITREI